MNIDGIENISELLTAIKSPFPDRASVYKLIKICHRISYFYISNRISNGKLRICRLGLSLNDLAWEGISELFKQDEMGYFAGFQCIDLSNNDKHNTNQNKIFIKLKLLVAGAVNDILFRLHRESDTDLGRLIRNIKLSVSSIHELEIIKKNGESVITSLPILHYTNNKLPLTEDVFYSELLTRIKGRTSLKSILKEAATVLNTQRQYQNYMPLTATALVIRRIYAEEKMLDEIPDFELPSPSDRENLIQQAIDNIKMLYGKKYISNNKIDDETLTKYFVAIKQILIESYVRFGEKNHSYYEIVCDFFPNLCREDYLGIHRTKFEYLVKLVRNEFIEIIKMEL